MIQYERLSNKLWIIAIAISTPISIFCIGAKDYIYTHYGLTGIIIFLSILLATVPIFILAGVYRSLYKKERRKYMKTIPQPKSKSWEDLFVRRP
jgi:O-antigen/teichoic acid export membrane protein